MKKSVDVSIIMPAYNTESYISQAIDSICLQKKPNVELVIVNDGSTDNTEAIIKEKMKIYNNIVYIKQENSGLSYARKVGLDKAKGEYIYFVDSDDFITSDSLNWMYEEAKKNNLDCLMINGIFKNELDNDFGYRMDNKNIVTKMSDTEIVKGEDLLIKMIKDREWRYAVWLYFIKKEALDKVTFFKDYIHEDSAFNYELLSNIDRIKYMNRTVYNYRLRKNSLMSTKTSIKNILGYVNSYSIIYQKNEEKNLKYENLLFEIRILDQIIEVYNKLDESEKEEARKVFEKIIPLIKRRNNYYVDRYRDFFQTSKVNYREKTDVLDYIDYLEVDIVDHCNLNCNNCSHYSPLAKPNFMSLDSFEKDMERLTTLIGGKLNRLVLMGGEPLLHKDISKFLEVARKHFPNTQIQILTNGILINKMNEVFWQTCIKNNIQINITTYPIKLDYYQVFNKVLSYGLKMFVYDNAVLDNKEFYSYAFDYTKKQDMNSNFINCYMAKTCANLKNGKIYICPIINNIGRYNNEYNSNLEIVEEDYLDIYNDITEKDIYSFLSQPAQFCKYCNLSLIKKVKWSRRQNEKTKN